MEKRAMFGVLLALAAALPGSFCCLEAERDCSLDMHCCQGMACQKDVGSVFGKCRSRAESSSDSEKYVVELYEDEKAGGRGVVVTNKADHLGTCQTFSDSFKFLVDQVSSIKWSANVVLEVYDRYDCGGNSLVLYSSGTHKMVTSNGMTEDSAFLAGYEANLQTVCKRDRCGYTSTSSSVSKGASGSVGLNLGIVSFSVGGGGDRATGKDVGWDRCECTKDWNDDIRSYRVFRRNVGTTKEVRR